MVDSAELSAPRTPAGAPEARGVHDMTRGSVRGHVVRMMLFVLAGLAMQTLYGLVDMYWVGRLGKEAVAAVSLSTNLMYLGMAVTQMLSVGCVALVSQAAGRKAHDEVQHLFNQAQSVSTFAGLVFLGACFAFRRTYAEGLSGNAATGELAATFLLLYMPALALQFTMVGLGSALRGIGDMKPGLVAQVLSVLLNMVLAPFFIFGWLGGHPLGVAGAALATLVSTFAAVIGLLIYLLRAKTFLRLRLASWRPELRIWGRMLGIGLPAGAEFMLMSIIMAVLFGVIRPFGAEAQAGLGIGGRVMQAGFMPAVAISFAVAAVVGQNFGARQYDRVREVLREAAKLTIGFMILFTLLCQIAPAALMRGFSVDPTVIAVGADYLQTVSYNYVASGLIFVIAGLFQGLGNTWPSLMASATRATIFVAPVLWLSQHRGFELHTIWLISVGSITGQLVLCGFLVRRELAIKAPLG